MTQPNPISQQEFAETFEAMHEGIAIFNAVDEITYFNRSFAVLHKEISHILSIGTPWALILNEAQKAGIGGGFAKIDLHLNALGGQHIKVDEERHNGTWVTLGVNAKASGGFILSVRDVTEAYAVTQMQNERDELIREVLDACDACVAMTEVTSGRFLYRTPAFNALFGGIGSAKEAFLDIEQRSDLLAALLPTKEVTDFPATLKTADHTIFPARVSARLVSYLGEDVIVSTTRDMSLIVKQRKEIARRRANEFQHEKLRAMGELLGGVAHELNNPLFVASGQALMLKEEVADSELLPRVEKIDQAVSRCTKIVKTFLAMARQKPAALEPCSINSICETALDVVSFGGLLDDCTVERDLRADPADVLADEDQIIQVLVNLITNALQAMKSNCGPKVLRISTQYDTASNLVTCSVRDTGPGMSEQVKARAFEPYFTTKPVGDGTGIGLAFSHRIVDSHNGEIAFNDAVQDGTEIVVSLNPMHAQRADQDENHQSEAIVIGGREEDVDTLSAVLKSMSFVPHCFGSFEDVERSAAQLQHIQIAFVCLDTQTLDAKDIERRIRKTHLYSKAELVFFSSKLKVEQREMIELETNIHILETPLNVRHLRKTIGQRANKPSSLE